MPEQIETRDECKRESRSTSTRGIHIFAQAYLPAWTIDLPVRQQDESDIMTLYKTRLVGAVAYDSQPNECYN